MMRAWAGRGVRERRSASWRERTSWNSRAGERPRVWARDVKREGLDSRGVKCLRY